MYFNRQKYTYFFFLREKRVSFLSLFVTCLMLNNLIIIISVCLVNTSFSKFVFVSSFSESV